VADRGYASQAFHDLVWQLGSRPVIPAKRHEAPVTCPPWIYVNRNRVERLWSRLKGLGQCPKPCGLDTLREDGLLLSSTLANSRKKMCKFRGLAQTDPHELSN
jgi:hypothetical protein